MEEVREVVTVTEAFWARTEEIAGPLETPCRVWTGAINSSGKPLVRVGKKVMIAYRVSAAAHAGKTFSEVAGLVACHRCDNPKCVAPGHHFWGSQADNVADMVAKGRNRNGATGPLAENR